MTEPSIIERQKEEFLEYLSKVLFERLRNREKEWIPHREQKVRLVFNELSSFEEIRNEAFEKAYQKIRSNRKDFNDAIGLYNEGNIFLGTNAWTQAVQSFTEAIRVCPFPDRILVDDEKNLLANCYRFRSQAFILLGNSENAMYDQIQSQYLLDNAINPHIDQQGVSYETQTIVSETYDNMVLDNDPTKGRCFNASRELIPGVWVLREKPLACVLYRREFLNFCCNCLKEADVCFWPCRDCNEVVFCSRECERIAFNAYHRYECGIAALLDFIPHGYLAYRLVTRVGCDMALQLNGEMKRKEWREEWIVSNRRNSVDVMVAYKAFITLYDHLDDLDADKECALIVCAIFIAFFMIYKNAFEFEMRRELYGSYNETDMSTFVEIVLLIHSHINKLNINSFAYTDENNGPQLGTAVMYLGSIFSHSCDCNVNYRWRNGYLVYFTNRELLPTEELTVSYGPDYRERGGVVQRRAYLSHEYHFECRCVACVAETANALGVKCDRLDCNGVIDYNESTNRGECLSCHEITDNFSAVIDSINMIIYQIQTLLEKLLAGIDVDICIRDIDALLTELTDVYLHGLSDDIIEATVLVSRCYAQIGRFDKAFTTGLKIFLKRERIEDYTEEEFQRLVRLTEYCGQYLDNFVIDNPIQRQYMWNFRLELHDIIIAIIRHNRAVEDNEELITLELLWTENKRQTEAKKPSLGL